MCVHGSDTMRLRTKIWVQSWLGFVLTKDVADKNVRTSQLCSCLLQGLMQPWTEFCKMPPYFHIKFSGFSPLGFCPKRSIHPHTNLMPSPELPLRFWELQKIQCCLCNDQRVQNAELFWCHRDFLSDVSPKKQSHPEWLRRKTSRLLPS